MTLARILIALAGLALAGAIIWAGPIQGAPLFAQGGQILQLPWGVVTLADLYVGFLIAAVIILLVEPNKLVATLWVIAIPILGNVVTALWAVIRLPMLARRLTGQNE